MTAPLSITDEELGLAIQKVFSGCEVPKRKKVSMRKD